MSIKIIILLLGVATAVGFGLGYFIRVLLALSKKGSIEHDIKQLMLDAKEEAKKITLGAEEEAAKTLKEVREELREKEDKLKKTEDRLVAKEGLLDRRQSDIDKEVDAIKQKINELREKKDKIEAMEAGKQKELESIARLSEEEAKNLLVGQMEQKYEEDLVVRLRKLEQGNTDKLDAKAREIMTSAVQRYANSVSPDIFTTFVSIPNDELKGKIIGKEGRNIKAFEKETGVEVIVDDTPGSITISCFDPVRRAIGKLALENLMLDGRIQPAKIEKEVEKAKGEVAKIIKEKGEQAAFECGVFNLDPRIISILGRLYFRTSYGQNVLQHSVEMAHIAGVIATELGANVAITKAGALLHDIGKAVDHEVQGTHVEIGRRILQKFGASTEIVKAMEAHHEEYPYETLESRIVQAADAISGGRPGARRDNVENYIKRLEDLEAIANSFKGIDKAYALQAGREIRVFVKSSEVTDLEASQIARDIAVKIENELKYPGEIRVTVIRENRTVEYAR